MRLIDSSMASWCEGEGIQVWSLEVASSSAVDTLRRVVQPWPIVVRDTQVYGVAAVPAECDRRLFRYTSATRRTLYYRLPSDMWGYFWDVSISPDGRYLLYLAMDSTGSEFAAVRRWPAGGLVARHLLGEDCECDVDRHHAHWVAPDSFELAVGIGPQHAYRRVSGSVSHRRFHVDTVTTTVEYWHPAFR